MDLKLERIGDQFARMRLRVAQTRLRVPLIWLHHRNLHPKTWWWHRGLNASDVFIASYPRSGLNWLMFQLIEILTGQSAEFDTMETVIPRIGWHTRVPRLLPGGGRLIHTHERYRSEYKRAIYLARDVRDVVLSQYPLDKKFNFYYTDSFERYLRAFLEGKVQGYAPWHEHVLGWLDSPAAQGGDLLVVRYEDRRANTEETLAKVLRFLGVDVDRRLIRQAVTNNVLERMRAKEDASIRYRPRREEGRRIVRGVVGGWREKLTGAQVQLIEHYAWRAMARLQYATQTATVNK